MPYVALGSGDALPVAELGDDVARALEGTEASSLVVMPMVVGERTVGSFVLGMLPPSTRTFSPGDVAIAGYLASRCGSLLETRRIRLALESALRTGERDRAVLDLVLANAPLGIAVVDRDLRYLLVNDALAAHPRPSQEDLLGRTANDIVDDSDAAATAELVARVLATGEPVLGVERDVGLPAAGRRAAAVLRRLLRGDRTGR